MSSGNSWTFNELLAEGDKTIPWAYRVALTDVNDTMKFARLIVQEQLGTTDPEMVFRVYREIRNMKDRIEFEEKQEGAE